VNENEVAERLEFDLPGWDIIDLNRFDSYVVLTCENDSGDSMAVRLAVADVSFEPGPPTREDFLPDRIEPGDDDVS
jgi:hypothetical protein